LPAFYSCARPHLSVPLEVSAEGNVAVSTSSVPDFRGTPIIFRLDVSPFTGEVLPIDDHRLHRSTWQVAVPDRYCVLRF
jgi:hypothetical protein